MVEKSRFDRRTFPERAMGSALALTAAMAASACAGPRVWTDPGPPQGGLSRVIGWGGAIVTWDTGPPYTMARPNSLVRPGSSFLEAEARDINGEVGHPMSVSQPTAACLPGGAWSGAPVVVSGELPRGLYLADGGEIRGIPEGRGHWIVTLSMTNITCLGVSYGGFRQQLRFHITGTGRVMQ